MPNYAQTLSAVTPVLDDLISVLEPQIESLQQWQGRHELLAKADPSKWHQKHWTDALGKAVMLRLLDGAPPRDQARLLEQATGPGTVWMSETPSAPLPTIIPSEEYSLALKWWLGSLCSLVLRTNAFALALAGLVTSLETIYCAAAGKAFPGDKTPTQGWLRTTGVLGIGL